MNRKTIPFSTLFRFFWAPVPVLIPEKWQKRSRNRNRDSLGIGIGSPLRLYPSGIKNKDRDSDFRAQEPHAGGIALKSFNNTSIELCPYDLICSVCEKGFVHIILRTPQVIWPVLQLPCCPSTARETKKNVYCTFFKTCHNR